MSCQVIGLLGLLALHSGCPRPPLGQKAAFWAKTVPLRVLGGPEEAQYQSKVCGNHDSNTDGAASGSRDQIKPHAYIWTEKIFGPKLDQKT